MSKQPYALAVLAAALAAAVPAQAQSRFDEVQKQVAASLSAIMPNGPSEVVNRLMNVRPDGAISRGFVPGRVSQAVFGRNTPSVAPDCRITTTPAKEADEGLCTLDLGSRDDPSGGYVALSYSKNIGMGNIKYFRRAAFQPGASEEPKPIRLTDEDAYKQALAFAELVGIPKSEIPLPPPGATRLFPVQTLVAGTELDRGKEARQYALQKVVTLPRAFAVPGGLLRDPATGRQLNHVIAPGSAVIAVDDAGIQFARVDGWSDAQMDPKLDAKLAKSLSTLTGEIAEDLYNEGVRQIGSMSILISLRKAYPHPDDPNPPLCPVCGVLRPALKVIVSQAPATRIETSEKAFAAPGLVREYDLVQQIESERAAR
ncbi:hypothetical protein V4F39_17310 [Aquincola sp. MAHUQ-54]|uniref:Uncharacterized protein n=1 Tax=Aquincola agrisoli TaxID=3119538 RepID=A0AAW9QJX3_9BURK